MNKPCFPLVKIDWSDHCHEGAGSWLLLSGLDLGLASCHTVGYLVHESDEEYIIASTVGDKVEDTITGVFHIGRALVTKVKYL